LSSSSSLLPVWATPPLHAPAAGASTLAIAFPLRVRREIGVSRGRLWCVHLDAAGTRVAASGSDRTVRVFDCTHSAAIMEPLKGHTDWVNALCFRRTPRDSPAPVMTGRFDCGARTPVRPLARCEDTPALCIRCVGRLIQHVCTVAAMTKQFDAGTPPRCSRSASRCVGTRLRCTVSR
jgi:WD40 repeat protein